MLQNLRENLKGAVAVFVLLIFIVPLVLFGVEQLFVGSVGGSDTAHVNGEGISDRDLQRQIVFDKMSLQQQYKLSPTDPMLDDSALREPALNRLVQRTALYQAAQDGAMAASTDALWKDIAANEAFQVEGKFDPQLFKQRISNYYTPATFLEASEKDYVLRQMNEGLSASGFVTESDIALIASITQQKRSFYAVEIPRKLVEEAVEISDEEIQSFYDESQDRFKTPERISIEYVEVTLDALAKANPASDDDIKAAYDMEVAEFSADPKYHVAHILIEAGDEAATNVSKVQERLAAGDAFGDVAKALSEDLGSKDSGGDLGVMIADAFPAEFVATVKSLSEGEVSGAVKTDAGTHFIELKNITNNNPPSFDERKDALAGQLSKEMAREIYISQIAKLDEFTFGKPDLSEASSKLNLEVKVSSKFTRVGGTGVAADKQVVDAAYAEDVFSEKQNSKVLELAGDRAIVVRLKEHEAEALKPLETVKATIETELKDKKITDLLEEKAVSLQGQLAQGAEAESLSKELGYDYQLIEETKRNDFELDRLVLNKAFSMARPAGSVVLDRVESSKGMSVVGVTKVADGVVADLSEQELAGLKGQLSFQSGRTDLSNFEQAVIAGAKVEKE